VGDREVDPLRVVAGGHEHAQIRGRRQAGQHPRDLGDHVVHHVVGVEIGIEDQVRAVAGLDDQGGDGVGQTAVGLRALRRGVAGVGCRRDRGLDLRPALGHPELGAVGPHRGVQRRHGIGHRGLALGQRGGGVLVAACGPHGVGAQRREAAEQGAGGRDDAETDPLLGAERDLAVLAAEVRAPGEGEGGEEDEGDQRELLREAKTRHQRHGRGEKHGGTGHGHIIGRASG
jgi:hypothetical protein